MMSALTVFALTLSLAADSVPEPPAGGSPAAAATEFVTALDHLDTGRVMAALAEDSSMFFPHPDASERVDGRDAIGRQMAERLEAGRRWADSAGRTEPPYLGLVASMKQLHTQWLGQDVATVTWVLDRPGNFGRRSATLRRGEDGAWRIVHFHASNLRPAD